MIVINEYLQMLWLSGTPISTAIHKMHEKYGVDIPGRTIQAWYDLWERDARDRFAVTELVKINMDKIKGRV